MTKEKRRYEEKIRSDNVIIKKLTSQITTSVLKVIHLRLKRRNLMISY